MIYLSWFTLGLIFIWYIIPVVFLVFFIPFSCYKGIAKMYNSEGISLTDIFLIILSCILTLFVSIIPFSNYSLVKFMITDYNEKFNVDDNSKINNTINKLNNIREKIVNIFNIPIFKKRK